MTIAKLKVEPVVIAGVAGFQIQGLYRDCSDTFWETIAHAAVFRDRRRAERFLKRVQAIPSWEWKGKNCWGAPVGSYYSTSHCIQHHVNAYSVI